MSDHRKRVPTSYPGIFKRGGSYVATWYDAGGKLRSRTARTLAEARATKRQREADRDRGELFDASQEPFGPFLVSWLPTFRGKRGSLKESTRADYKLVIDRYARPYFGNRKLGELTTRDLSDFVTWLMDERTQGQHARKLRLQAEREAAKREGRAPKEVAPAKPRRLSDQTIRNVFYPLRACLAEAARQGLIRTNPAVGVVLPSRQQVVEEEDEVQALTTSEVKALLRVVDPKHRLMIEFDLATGLRRGELLALRWSDLTLDGHPSVRVRRQFSRGKIEPPKTKHALRTIPLSLGMADKLVAWRRESKWNADDDLVFPNYQGTFINPDNFQRRVMRPALAEALARPIKGMGLHLCRHSAATLLAARGTSIVAISRWLGHGSTDITLRVYCHLLDGDLGEGLDLTALTPEGGNARAMSPSQPAIDDFSESRLESEFQWTG